MSLTSRRTSLSSILGVALVMAVAAPSHAQYLAVRGERGSWQEHQWPVEFPKGRRLIGAE